MTDKRVLTTGEAAKYCGVNFRTVIRWIERGRLKAYKLPGRGDHRITEEDFVVFLRQNNMPVPPELESGERTILVIEDQPEMASAIRRVLLRQGYQVEVAHDGFSAGAMLMRLQPALVTLDLKMPGMDGFQVLEFMRAQEAFAATAILVISAETSAGLERALSLGASAVLPKPFGNDALIASVSRLLGD